MAYKGLNDFLLLLTTKLMNRVNKNKRPWADLPQEILESIMEQLRFADQVRFRGVCRSWRLIHGIKPNFKFPWIIMYDDKNDDKFPMQLYCLYIPSSRKSHIVKNKVKTRVFANV